MGHQYDQGNNYILDCDLLLGILRLIRKFQDKDLYTYCWHKLCLEYILSL